MTVLPDHVIEAAGACRTRDDIVRLIEKIVSDTPAGSVPERETFWLLERHDGKAWALYTSNSGVFVHSYTEDVWQAGRFQSERHAHDVWRSLEKSERERWKPVEHMFINKVQPLPASPALTEKRPPSIQEGGK